MNNEEKISRPSKKILKEVDWNKYAEQYDAITMSGSNPAYTAEIKIIRNIFILKYLTHNNIFNSEVFDVNLKEKLLIKSDCILKYDAKDITFENVNMLFGDIGGGTGNASLSLAQYFPNSKFVIVDISEKMLEIAQKKASSKGLKNVDFVLEDMESIDSIVKRYSRPLDNIVMMHSLYATRTKEDPEKPERILSNISANLASDESLVVICDINRQLNTSSWIPYCLWNKYRECKSVTKTINFFKENDQAKLANRRIDRMQKSGEYLMCDIDKFNQMIIKSGLEKIKYSTDRLYRGRDNMVIAGR